MKLLILLKVMLFSINSAYSENVKYYIGKGAAPLQIFEGENLMHSGIVTEIVSELFKGTKFELKPAFYPFNNKLKRALISKNKYWVTYSSPDWKDPELKGLDQLLEVPLFPMSQVLISKKKSALKISQPDQLLGKTLILIRGFDYPGVQEYFGEGSSRINTFRTDDNDSALKMLSLDRGHGFIDGHFRAIYNMKRLKFNLSDYSFHNISNIITPPQIHLQISVEFSKKEIKFFNDKLLAMKKNGFIKKIISKYLK